ncbi:MAG: hypothetical protein NTW87_20650, partial [Planctomycetota bacterium]|nr:hypothetical protein [Planctomycetota bacterium]
MRLGAAMVGLAGTEHVESGTLPLSRWAIVFMLVALVHSAPMLLVTLAAAPPTPDDLPAIAVDFSDFLDETPGASTTDSSTAPPPATAAKQVPPPATGRQPALAPAA